MLFFRPHYAITLAGMFINLSTYAGVEIGGTRLIYNEKVNQANISVNNPDDKPYLIQSWIDNNSNNGNDDTFLTTPPIFKLEAGEQNSVRVVYTGKPLTKDRESLFWLNIKSIPSIDKNKTNQLLIAVNTKIKLFYRPSALKGKPDEAYTQLNIRAQKNEIIISNPTEYNISIYQFSLDGQPQKNITTIAAKSAFHFDYKGKKAKTATWNAINDYGSITEKVSKNVN